MAIGRSLISRTDVLSLMLFEHLLTMAAGSPLPPPE